MTVCFNSGVKSVSFPVVSRWGLLVLTIILTVSKTAQGLNCNDSHRHAAAPFGEAEEENWEWAEFTELCDNLRKLRTTKNAKLEDEIACEEEAFDPAQLHMLFVLMLMIAYGAFVRTVLRYLKLGIPYTVVLMLSGLLIGHLSKRFCNQLHTYTAIARIPPKIILFVFLPVLIFESAFSITPHTFVRSLVQILIVALPGMLIATFMTAVVVNQFLYAYNWKFLEASLFGSIISATDPVAVVAILRELGTSEMLSVMIEGESLLNDGVAILLYEILEKILTCQVPPSLDLPLFVFLKFCQITLGGPLFGYVMGKIAVFCLSVIFNDATVEITITLVAAYLTYYIGENILGVSGVMAVVVLGITMGSERTSISPEVENFVHHFWEMLGYLANTVLFMVVGIVITETALNNINAEDWIYLVFLYIMLNIIRFLMLLLMYPLVSRIGYGLTWQSMIVMMWGGLRGAVGICLALDVYDNKHLCDTKLGPKFLFQTAGIVFLTLVLNGTTTKLLLNVLKLTEISSGRIQDMSNAMKQLQMAQLRTISMLKHDRFVADANWSVVDKFTTIKNPYAKKKTQMHELPPTQSLVSIKPTAQEHHTECPDCHAMVENEPTTSEYTEMTEEARLRVLKALKVSFWRQFEQGILIEVAVQLLVNVASSTEDKPLRLIHAHDLRKYWSIHGCLPWMKTKFLKTFGLEEEILPPKPQNTCRQGLWWLATRVWFDYVIIGIVLLNMIPGVWETVNYFQCKAKPEPERTLCDKADETAFLITSIIFNSIYLAEAIIKVVGRGFRDYFCTHKFNWVDLILLILGIIDIIVTISSLDNLPAVFAVIKIIRVGRALRLLRPLVPKLMRYVDRRINAKLFLGYDVGKGFVTAVDDVIKFLPQMVDHPKVMHKLRHALEHERLKTVCEMGIMQKDHPGIAIAVKTRHASRAVLNQMREALLELKEDGLVDEKECDLLMIRLEEKMKRLWDSPPSIPPASPESLLGNVTWLMGNQELFDFIHSKAELISFAFGDPICVEGDPPNGVFIITSGMVKIHYIPTEAVVKAFDDEGEVPNMDMYVDLTFRSKADDFFSTGTVIGEQGVLTGQLRAATVKCETNVFAYHISQSAMEEALQTFKDPYDSLEARMWRAVGMKLAFAVLPKHPTYSAWGVDKIRLHVERSCVPIGEKFNIIPLSDFVSDILVIHGKVKDAFSDDIYYAPSIVPRSVSKIVLNSLGSHVPARVLVIAATGVDIPATGQRSAMSLQQCIEAAVQAHKHPVNIDMPAVQPVNTEHHVSHRDHLRRLSKSNHLGIGKSVHMSAVDRKKARRDLSKKPLGFPKSVTKRKRNFNADPHGHDDAGQPSPNK